MRRKARILVVDDNRALVRVTERVLQKEGFDVLTAFDGKEGLEKAEEGKPDLIILDIVMPKIDGYAVCRRLQENPNTSDIPVLLLTVKGRIDREEMNLRTITTRIGEQTKGFQVGAIEFLSKPIKARELVTRVKSLLWLTGNWEDITGKWGVGRQL